jgi:hypothetical protein
VIEPIIIATNRILSLCCRHRTAQRAEGGGEDGDKSGDKNDSKGDGDGDKSGGKLRSQLNGIKSFLYNKYAI